LWIGLAEGVSMAKYVLGVWSDITCSEGINKAFVVNEADLKHFYRMGKKWVEEDRGGDVAIRCKALLKKTKDALLSDSIDTVLEYNNPSKRAIYDISLQMCCREKGRTFQVDFQSYEYPNLIQATVGGANSVLTEELFRNLMAELNDTTQWYWFLVCRRWLQKVASWTFWIFLVLLVCFGTLSVVGTSYRNYQIKKQREELLKKYPPIEQKLLPIDRVEKKDVDDIKQTQPKVEVVKPEVELWDFVLTKQFLAGMGIIVGGVFLERITVYLFPKAVFEIGKGKQRHERLKARRKWIARVLTAIIIAGIIVPIIKKFVMKFF